MTLKFNKIKNNCYYVEVEKITFLISYESIIGFIYDGILYLSDAYIKYSRTTSRHITYLKNNLSYHEEKIISDNDMYLILCDIKISNINIIEEAEAEEDNI